jgi:hypothetical protein
MDNKLNKILHIKLKNEKFTYFFDENDNDINFKELNEFEVIQVNGDKNIHKIINIKFYYKKNEKMYYDIERIDKIEKDLDNLKKENHKYIILHNEQKKRNRKNKKGDGKANERTKKGD